MRLRNTVIAAVLAAVVLSGCGAAEKLSPQLAVRDAANTTVDAKRGTFTFSLVGSADDLNAVLNQGATLSDEDRKGLALLGQATSPSARPGLFGLDVKVGGIDHAVEVRYVVRSSTPGPRPAIADLMGRRRPGEPGGRGLADKGFAFLKDAAAASGWWPTSAAVQMVKGFAGQFGAAGKARRGGFPPSSRSTPVSSRGPRRHRHGAGRRRRRRPQGAEIHRRPLRRHNQLRPGTSTPPCSGLGQLPAAAKLPPAERDPDRPVTIDAG